MMRRGATPLTVVLAFIFAGLSVGSRASAGPSALGFSPVRPQTATTTAETTTTTSGTTTTTSGTTTTTMAATTTTTVADTTTTTIAPTTTTIAPPITRIDDRQITLRSPTDIANRRKQLIQFVWGSSGFPSAKLPSVETGVPTPLPSIVENVQRVDRLRFRMDNDQRNLAYHFIPQRGNGRVVIVHQGHFCSLDDRIFNDTAAGASVEDGVHNTIKALLRDGYAVMAMFMPRYTPEECAMSGDAHSEIFRIPTATGSPMKFFLEPVAVALNHLKRLKPGYTDFSMTGLSGGGWTTTVYSAIDPTISFSAPVAGSMPLYLRPLLFEGDLEQTLPDFYRIAGYPDLYVMGSYGPDRRQVQVLNRRDSCCFGERYYRYASDKPGWTAEVREYELRVRAAVRSLGSGAYRLEIDEAASYHTISYNTQVNVILSELNGGRRYVGAASKTHAFVRGINGKLVHWTASGFSDTGIAVVGVPAVLERSPNPLDVFYRNPVTGGWPPPPNAPIGTPLRHAYLSASGWVDEELPGGPVISDPVALSSGADGWDVVAVGSDYRLYRWSWRAGSTVALELLSETTSAVGTPAFVRSGPSRYHVFFRGWDRTAWQLTRDGDGPWTRERLGTPVMLDFPAAIATVDGALRVYIRDLNNQIVQISRTSAIGWHVTPVSEAGNAPRIESSGSPSVSFVPGNLSVYSRTSQERLASYTVVSGRWEFLNNGGRVTGSPTAVPGGAWVRGVDGDLRLLDGVSWRMNGGSLE